MIAIAVANQGREQLPRKHWKFIGFQTEILHERCFCCKSNAPDPIFPPAIAMSLRNATLVFAMLVLGACSNAPAGFHAVPAVDWLLKENECPQLAGTFNLTGHTDLASAIDTHTQLKTYGLPVVLTFKQGTAHQEAWWVIPRQSLLSFASTLRTDEPQRYMRWRSLMLMEYARQQVHPLVDDYLADVAEVGPPGPVNANFQPSLCRNNWGLAQDSIEFDHTDPDGWHGKLSHETWLAHDKTGALLVKHLTYKVGFVALPNALTRVRSADYTRFEPMPFEAPTPFVTADLPAVSQ